MKLGILVATHDGRMGGDTSYRFYRPDGKEWVTESVDEAFQMAADLKKADYGYSTGHVVILSP